MSYLGSRNLNGSAGYCLATVAISSSYLDTGCVRKGTREREREGGCQGVCEGVFERVLEGAVGV